MTDEPVLASRSSIWVAQITGRCAAWQSHQDLLLDLREALVAALHGKIAAGDHHSGGPLATERGQEHPRQMLKRAPRLDLQDHPDLRSRVLV